MQTQPHSHGFTLIEMAIVLTIVGLLIAGAVAGDNLIRQAKLRSVIGEVNEYKSTIYLFKEQYNAFPGDMDNATTYWSGTANGDGDGLIEESSEDKRLWQHLNLAEMAPGNYAGTGDYGIGTTLPDAAVKGGGYWVHNNSTAIFGRTGHTIDFAALKVSAPTALTYSIISVEDTQTIDEKMDDGLADKGTVRATNGADDAATDCTTANGFAATSGNYQLGAGTEILCRMFFFLD